MKKIKMIFLLITYCLITQALQAATFNRALLGNWITIDDKTNKPSSVITLFDRGGVVFGKVSHIFVEGRQHTDDICRHCQGADRNKPILGLVIIKNMHCENNKCVDGRIVDPRDGKVYHARMQLIDGGRALNVRGYVGIPLFGRSVTWYRQQR
jgi:uncharacterized protein (DUF2147 family)